MDQYEAFLFLSLSLSIPFDSSRIQKKPKQSKRNEWLDWKIIFLKSILSILPFNSLAFLKRQKPLVEFKAGKMHLDGNMVKPDKRKGMVILTQVCQ